MSHETQPQYFATEHGAAVAVIVLPSGTKTQQTQESQESSE
jgi:hypothetical protein